MYNRTLYNEGVPIVFRNLMLLLSTKVSERELENSKASQSQQREKFQYPSPLTTERLESIVPIILRIYTTHFALLQKIFYSLLLARKG